MWYKTTFPVREFPDWLENDITIIHNMDIKGLCGNAFLNWYFRDGKTDQSAESFAKYINSKTSMSGHKAYTEKEWSEFIKIKKKRK